MTGSSEGGRLLALVDALFAAFVAVQFRYLFGGEAMVGAASLTRAEYARRGFFELATVVALVVPMLLVAEWIIDKRDARLYVFQPNGTVVDAAPVLLGSARGDDSWPGIGNVPIKDVKPYQRTTAAGRFVTQLLQRFRHPEHGRRASASEGPATGSAQGSGRRRRHAHSRRRETLPRTSP